jgi:hypothetical protein
MQTLCGLLMLTGAYPLWRAWQANRQTSLLQAVNWAILSWAAWGLALAVTDRSSPAATMAGHYLALCVTGCAAVAVLGARRPGVGTWNFVVLALLAVDLLPVAEGVVTGVPLQLDSLRLTCVAATLAVGVLNYLPTRFAAVALLLLLGCGLELAALVLIPQWDKQALPYLEIGYLPLASVPWVAFWCVGGDRPAASEFDRLWLDFRNRFGFVWGQRLRDQFNRSAGHAGWPAVLRWQGLRLSPGARLPDQDVQSAMVGTLRALMKRFGPEEEKPGIVLS